MIIIDYMYIYIYTYKHARVTPHASSHLLISSQHFTQLCWNEKVSEERTNVRPFDGHLALDKAIFGCPNIRQLRAEERNRSLLPSFTGGRSSSNQLSMMVSEAIYIWGQ